MFPQVMSRKSEYDPPLWRNRRPRMCGPSISVFADIAGSPERVGNAAEWRYRRCRQST
jgi:hypothetical protein